MRHTWCALVGLTLLICWTQTASAETGSRWWPFGQKDEAAAELPPVTPAPSATTSPLLGSESYGNSPQLGVTAPLGPQSQGAAVPPETTAKESWMYKSDKGKVGWPRLNKPKLPSFTAKQPTEAPRNSWVQPEPVTPKPSPLKPITDGASKVGKSTKAAWHKTVDAITPGEPKSPSSRTSGARIAKKETQPPFWKRMWGEKPEPQPSQTMPGFIAQQRVDSANTKTR